MQNLRERVNKDYHLSVLLKLLLLLLNFLFLFLFYKQTLFQKLRLLNKEKCMHDSTHCAPRLGNFCFLSELVFWTPLSCHWTIFLQMRILKILIIYFILKSNRWFNVKKLESMNILRILKLPIVPTSRDNCAIYIFPSSSVFFCWLVGLILSEDSLVNHTPQYMHFIILGQWLYFKILFVIYFFLFIPYPFPK